jgi:peptide/nickel transport system substrate-binding protein
VRASRRTRSLLLGFLLGGLVLAGCGGGDDEATPALATGGEPGEGGTLVWSIANKVDSVDPLEATTRAQQLVSRQIHEPLIESLAGPFGDPRRLPGLALNARPRAGGEIWNLSLRPGIRFQDGSPFNAGAVLANVERWRTTAAGRELLPDLTAADAPRPDLVRLFLTAPDPDLPDRLADPRLGIVSPAALRPDSGTAAEVMSVFETGTGPFELRERTGAELLLAPNLAWWGTPKRLGPALDQLRFPVEASGAARVDDLVTGTVQLADELDDVQAGIVRDDPLLTVLPGERGLSLALERSVRGVESGTEIPSLSGAWLTTITVAD